MFPEARRQAQKRRPAPISINVRRTLGGRWEVVVSDRRQGIRCERLEDALRIAHVAVAQTGRCELIVRDAYDRVIEHELLQGGREAEPASKPL